MRLEWSLGRRRGRKWEEVVREEVRETEEKKLVKQVGDEMSRGGIAKSAKKRWVWVAPI